MNFAQACQGLQNVIHHLSRAALVQIDNCNIRHTDQIISWRSYRPGIVRNAGYPFEYQFLLDNQQYSLLLRDGSFFQFYFSFVEDELRAGRLAFYPKPVPLGMSGDSMAAGAEEALSRGDEQLLEYFLNWVEILELSDRFVPSNTSHIRFDFDATVQSHSASHIQLGAIQDLRIPASVFPLPMAFVQLCQTLVEELLPIDSRSLAFERRNCLQLQENQSLISLSSPR